jgi:hypothetical protein
MNWDADHFTFAAGPMVTALVFWVLLCRKSLAQRQVTIADVCALIILISIVLGITSWL